MAINEFQFVVQGLPQAKERPRFSKGVVYTPKKTKVYEHQVGLTASIMMNSMGVKMFEGAVELDVIAGMPIPKSFTNKKREQIKSQGMYHICKPDMDNILKSIKDGLKGIAYKDDSQVCNGTYSKVYSEEPQVWVRVREIDILIHKST